MQADEVLTVQVVLVVPMVLDVMYDVTVDVALMVVVVEVAIVMVSVEKRKGARWPAADRSAWLASMYPAGNCWAAQPAARHISIRVAIIFIFFLSYRRVDRLSTGDQAGRVAFLYTPTRRVFFVFPIQKRTDGIARQSRRGASAKRG